jgi:ElaB/YqjD/DUF883 family membrane-anchored ribosome-binding protein
MDHRADDIRRDIEGTRAAMTDKVGMVAERAQETMEAVKSTADRAMAGFKQVQETVEGAKSAVNTVVDSVKLTVEETGERVKTTADLLDQVRQNPWVMLGGAILLGYMLGSLARNVSSAPGRTPDRSHPLKASAHGGQEASEAQQHASGYPAAVVQCSTCGQMVRQADMAGHSALCTG